MTNLLAVHQNQKNSLVITFPLPLKINAGKDSSSSMTNCVIPTGESLNFSINHNQVGDLPYVFGFDNRRSSDLPSRIKGIAVSEGGNCIALSIDNQFWVWQQYPEEVKGVGYWIDLTDNKRFGTNIESNHPITQVGQTSHGFMKPRQTFTLHPVLSPNLPQNSAISYQDLCLFDNPDEGCGVVCLTALLPPCKPFDTLYLFVSICTLNGTAQNFQRADTKLSVIEGSGSPCIWWSRDCRLAVIAVSQTLLIVTRFLRVVSKIPLKEIFPGNSPIVSSIAWSCSGHFFVVTSLDGRISAVTRSGISMRHALCSLTAFQPGKENIIMVCADSVDPGLFIIYSKDKFRELKIDVEKVPQTIENLMSLHFPQGSVEPMWTETLNSITENGCGLIRAYLGFKCDEVVPNELIDFEDFNLPNDINPKMELKTTVDVHISDGIEEEEEIHEEEVKENVSLPLIEEEEKSDSGEYIPEPEPEPEPIRIKKPKVKQKQKKIKQKPKLKKIKHKQIPEPKQTPLRLITIDKGPPHYRQYVPPPPQYSQFPQFTQQRQTQNNFPWDFAGYPTGHPTEQRTKTVDVPTQAKVSPESKNVRPTVIITSRSRKAEQSIDISSDSSELSSLHLTEPRRREIRCVDPFPTDEQLHVRVEKLLDEAKSQKDPSKLPPPPKFVRPSMKATPIQRAPESEREVKKKRVEVKEVEKRKLPKEDPKRNEQWKPKVHNVNGTRVLGVREISEKEFRPKKEPKLQLKEIQK
ncbi:hypothetical protein GPJ56_005993 [Histomonas meleagridis]|uniref:uncharacterized protein n=1 Tax=Histomonas meleagridis TaxID=135588 RepID=UPI003559C005|nr:hypothetical protein GPJ56_005993 [Histomonas meleagridis]KAH0799400.1 hypothetical protein GO595_007801 [Histomonas meleagridis]